MNWTVSNANSATSRWAARARHVVLALVLLLAPVTLANAQERLPWDPPPQGTRPSQKAPSTSDPYSPSPYDPTQATPRRRELPPPRARNTAPPRQRSQPRAAPSYTPPPRRYARPDDDAGPSGYRRRNDNDAGSPPEDGTYSQNEIVNAGHKFFGAVSRGLADAIAYAFRKQGRPNGYILGEDAGAAFVAGLRYGEGRMFTKHWGVRRVYWQGPSIGYDFGGEGSKVMVLVYNLRRPGDIFHRFGGVQGSAYLVGGVGVQLQKREHVTLAPIRAGVGLRFGANVGYLKYTRRPTWNPF